MHIVEKVLIAVLFAFVLVILAAGIVGAGQQAKEFKAHCHAKGGTVLHNGRHYVCER